MDMSRFRFTRTKSSACGNYRFLPLLMSLPLELREQIYYYALLEEIPLYNPVSFHKFRNDVFSVIARDRRSTLAEAKPMPEILPDLCCINRTLFRETLPVFLRLCTIMVIGRGPTHALCKLLHLVPANAAYHSIRDLHIWVPPLDALDTHVMRSDATPTHALHLIKLCAPSLRQLKIEISADCLTTKTRVGWQVLERDTIARKFDFAPLSRCTVLGRFYLQFYSSREIVEKKYSKQMAELQMTLATKALEEVERSGSNAEVQISPFPLVPEYSYWSVDDLDDGYVGWGNLSYHRMVVVDREAGDMEGKRQGVLRYHIMETLRY